MKINRAYSILNVKGMDEDKRVVRGWATTPEADRVGDVVEPLGVEFKNPLPLLIHHDSRLPVGTVKFEKPTKNGIRFEAQLAKVDEPGVLKDRVDEAWQSVKAGLITAVSIGFRAMADGIEQLADGGLRFLKTEVMELSLVVIPANRGAVITEVKTLDRRTIAALSENRAGVAVQAIKGPKVKTIQEKLAELRAEKAQLAAHVKTLTDTVLTGDGVLSDEDNTAIEGHTANIATIDKSIASLVAAESLQLGTAQNVTKTHGRVPGGMAIVKKADPEEQFEGQNYTRRVIAKAVAFSSQGDLTTGQVAEMRWGKSHPQLVQTIKAAVAGGGTGTGEWGAELVQNDTRYTGDFIEYLHGQTLFDQLPLRTAPANVAIRGQDGSGTGYWVGESKAIPMSKADYSSVDLRNYKVAALTTLSKELLENSTPAAEQLIRDDLVASMARRVDQTFFSAAAASAGVSPAGILNGLTAIPSTGVTAEQVRDDIMALLAPFLAASNATGLHIVTTSALAMVLRLMRNPLGQSEFPELASGQLVIGKLHAGDHVASGNVIMLKPSDIYRIGDSGLEFSVSRDATIEQDNAPTGASDTPAASSANMVSMFQTDSVAIKMVRPINFAKRRASAVSYIADAAYAVTPP